MLFSDYKYKMVFNLCDVEVIVVLYKIFVWFFIVFYIGWKYIYNKFCFLKLFDIFS